MKWIIDFIEASNFFMHWLLLLSSLVAIVLLIVLLYRFFVVLGLIERIARGMILKQNALTETLRLIRRFCNKFTDDSDAE